MLPIHHPPRNGRIVEGVSLVQYHADQIGLDVPSLSNSIAVAIVSESPAHAFRDHPRLGNQRTESTREMDAGTLAHRLVLGAGAEIVECPFENWRTDAAKLAASKARADGKIPVLPKMLAEAKVAADKIAERMRTKGVILSGRSEVMLAWEETATDGTVVPCRAMLDHLIRETATIYDFKKTSDAKAWKIARSCDDYGYDVQREAYTRAAWALTGHEDPVYRWIFAEVENPWPVTIAEADGSMRELGAQRWRRAIDTWAKCLRTGVWPDYESSVVRIGAMPWTMQREMDHGFKGV